MEQLGYSESRNTQQNVDFREELKAALDMDKDITPDEAKILTEKYEAVRDTMIEWKKQILAISKDELTSLSEGLDVSYASVWATIKKLYDVSMEDNNYTPSSHNVDTPADEVVSSVEDNTAEIPVVEENVITTNDVIKSPQEASEILKNLDKPQREYLQTIIWAYPDSIIGAGTKKFLNNFLNKHSLSLSELIDKYEVDSFHLDYDYEDKLPKWEISEVRERFKQKYSPLTGYLENTLGIPDGINNAIARKESSYFTNLNSGSGSKWGMQLTKWPFQDMRWFGAEWETPTSTKNIRENKIRKYQEIFKMITFTDLKALSAWNGKTIWETLPTDIWLKLESISTSSPEQAEIAIAQLQGIIKWTSNKKNYLHTLNIIIGDVYLKYLYQHEWGQDVQETARKYNNDTKGAVYRAYRDKLDENGDVILNKDGKPVREAYWEKLLDENGKQRIVRDVYAETVVKYMESQN